MTDEEALLAGVLMDLGVDLPRLVLADWLDEHGEGERAEFIRVQCELAEVTRGWKQSTVYPERYFNPEKREYPAITPEIAALRKRERELLSGPKPHLYLNSVCWFNSGNGTETWSILFRPKFRRGFVSSLTLSAEGWLAHADAMTWCWGKCGRCRGVGSGYGRLDCPACSGLGRVGPTMACPTHQPDRIVDQTAGGSHTYRCPTCKGSGRVPRPCPATAQPIEHVHLTTGVDFADVETWGVVIWRGPRYSTVFNSDHWPGITFHLPQTFEERGRPLIEVLDEGTQRMVPARRRRR